MYLFYKKTISTYAFIMEFPNTFLNLIKQGVSVDGSDWLIDSLTLKLVGLGTLVAFVTIATHFPSGKHPIVHFPSNPALLAVRSEDIAGGTENVSLQKLMETRCKSLFREFRELWWLCNGHLQTFYCTLGNFSKVDRMWFKRTYLRLSDGGTVGLDFTPVDDSPLTKDTPIVVVQHGLTGGSYEAYVRAILSRACAPKEAGGLGYRAVVINFRGCAGVPITSQLFYSAGNTADTRAALAYIAQQFPDAPLLGLGFSLGANVITRYLGEEGANSRLQSACALACPWDLKLNSYGLLSSFVGKHLYSKALGGNLQALMKRHLAALTRDSSHYVARAAEVARSLKKPTMNEFDEAFTRIAGGPAPHWPFPDADAYYVWCSSHTIVDKIRVPFLAINAEDDPVVRHVPMAGGGNSLVVMTLTKGGGHLGWFQAGPGYVDRWTTEPVLEWLKLMGQDLVYDREIRKGLPLFTDADGFLREEGKDGLGVKFAEDGGIIDGNNGEGGMTQGL